VRAKEVNDAVCERIRARVIEVDEFFTNKDDVDASFCFSTHPSGKSFSVKEYKVLIFWEGRVEAGSLDKVEWNKERLKGVGIEVTEDEGRLIALHCLWELKDGREDEISALERMLANPWPGTDVKGNKRNFGFCKLHLENLNAALRSLGF